MKKLNMMGQTFGLWTLLTPMAIEGRSWYRCRCICGTERTVSQARLRSGDSKSCGCSRNPSNQARASEQIATYRGKVFGALSVQGEGGASAPKARVMSCICLCGKVVDVKLRQLLRGASTSCSGPDCGFLEVDGPKPKVGRPKVTEAQMEKTKPWRLGMDVEYTLRSYFAMKSRCLNPENPYFHRYGGRGITMDERWLDLEVFLQDMGPRPVGYSLDRIDNEGNYCKENCRWATDKEQSSNTRKSVYVEYKGEKMTAMESSRRSGIARGKIYHLAQKTPEKFREVLGDDFKLLRKIK